MATNEQAARLRLLRLARDELIAAAQQQRKQARQAAKNARFNFFIDTIGPQLCAQLANPNTTPQQVNHLLTSATQFLKR